MGFFDDIGIFFKVKDVVKSFTDNNAELKKELACCEIAAHEGYALAYKKYFEIQKTLSAESQR